MSLHADAQCGGAIVFGTAAGTPLDPNGDGFITASGSGFTGCTGEIDEFEAFTNPSGCPDCQAPWSMVERTEPSYDLLTPASGCSKVDIVPDAADPASFFYYTMTDPDGVCSSGDELIFFRVRLADAITSGAWTVSLLVDTDFKVGDEDPDGVQCGSKVANIGYEYEIQLITSSVNKGVHIWDIDGLVGATNCPGGDPCASYDRDAHSNMSEACGSSCGCRAVVPTDPVFVTFYIPRADLNLACGQTIRLYPATSTSPNGVVIGNSSVSDIGGIGDETDDDCGCFTACSGGGAYFGCTGTSCYSACLGLCNVEGGSVLPVTWLDFSGSSWPGHVDLEWTVAQQVDNAGFVVQTLDEDEDWVPLGFVPGHGNRQTAASFTFSHDVMEEGARYYRLMQLDRDGAMHPSPVIAVEVIAASSSDFTWIWDGSQWIVRSLSGEAGEGLLELHDMAGRTVAKRPVHFKQGRNEWILDDLDPGAGMYVGTLRGPGKHAVRRVAKP